MKFKKSLFVISFLLGGFAGQVCCEQNSGLSRFSSLVGPVLRVLSSQRRIMPQWLSSSCNRVLNVCKTYPVSVSLFAAHLCVYAAQLYYGHVNGSDLNMKFGKWNSAVQRGQWWRLCTSMFLHANLLHLAMNNYSLVNLSPLEQHLGSKKFFALYMASGIFANLMSYLLGKPQCLSVGASGAIYGLLGAAYGIAIKRGGVSAGVIAKSLVPGFILSISGALPHQDNVAHASGLAGGYILGKIFAD